MRGFGPGIVLLVLAEACAPITGPQAPESASSEALTGAEGGASSDIMVRDVRVERDGGGRRVTLVLSREAEGVDEHATTNPPRLVIDLTGPRLHEPMAVSRFPLTDDVVSQVRVGSHDGTLRAVIDMSATPGSHVVQREGATIVAQLGDPVPGAAEPAMAGTATPPAAEPWLAVRDVRVEPAGAGRRLVIALTREPDNVKQFLLDSPPRLVVDLAGPAPQDTAPARFPVSDDQVSRVRSAWNNNKLRVVIDLQNDPKTYAVHPQGSRLVADIGDTGVAAGEPADDVKLTHAVATEPLDSEFSGPGEALPPAAPHVAAYTEPVTPPTEAPAAQAEDKPTPVVAAPPIEKPEAPAPARLAIDDEPPVDLYPVAVRRDRRVVAGRSSHDAPRFFKGQRISLDFKDADIQNVLRVLADVSQMNIIATDDVKGKVTLHLTDVPWDQALDLVLRSNRLEMTREGNVARISTVARLKEEREALRAAEQAELELEPLNVAYERVNYARADDILVDKVKGVLSERGSVTFDDRTNTVIIRDVPQGVAQASELIKELDVQSPQVLIEANLVEATEDFARALGVQWGYGYKAGPQTGNPTGMNFPGTIGIGGSGLGAGVPAPAPATGVVRPPVPFIADFPVPGNIGSGFGPGVGSALDLAFGSIDGTQTLSARLTALEEQGKGKVISRPRVITMNNVAATIQSLTILRVKLPSTGTVINTGAGGAAGSASTATEKINTGITLVVTPQISADGFVLLNIYAKSSQPDFTKTVDGIPNEISREANSNVLIHDGETVVLGGIFRNTDQDNESGIPYLRKVPALGWLFKRQLRSNHREELLVFLSPKIVSGVAAQQLPGAQQLWEERRRGG